MTRFPAPINPESSCDQMLAALRRIGRALDLHSRYLARHHGLTGPQLLVLRELSRTKNCTVGRLAEAICVSQATLTGIIDRLERKDLVRRRRDKTDKRRVVVTVTAAGRRMLRATPSPLQASFVERFTRLEPQEQAQILASLQRLVAMMESAAESGALPVEMSETSAQA